MKTIAMILPLFFLACGQATEERAQAPLPTATPLPQVTATPSPQPSHDEAFVGNWIDKDKNTLALNKDGSAQSNQTLLSWTESGDALTFTSGPIRVDLCDWTIVTSGGLNTPLSIVLTLACEKAGVLSFTRQ